MFFLESGASKVALVHLVQRLRSAGFHFLDCQVQTDHMEHFGARDWERERFLKALRTALQEPTQVGKWGSAVEGPDHRAR